MQNSWGINMCDGQKSDEEKEEIIFRERFLREKLEKMKITLDEVFRIMKLSVSQDIKFLDRYWYEIGTEYDREVEQVKAALCKELENKEQQ